MATSTNIVSPYIITNITTTINLMPFQLNNNILTNILLELKKLEGKCYKDYGFISNILSIIKYSDGILINEDDNANVSYKVEFQCKICIPMKDMVILAHISHKSNELIILNNGPMRIYVQMNDLDKVDMNMDSFTIGMYVRVILLKHSFFHGDQFICIKGRILGIETSDDIMKQYFETLYQ